MIDNLLVKVISDNFVCSALEIVCVILAVRVYTCVLHCDVLLHMKLSMHGTIQVQQVCPAA